jgi:hypothetical protein
MAGGSAGTAGEGYRETELEARRLAPEDQVSRVRVMVAADPESDVVTKAALAWALDGDAGRSGA